MVLPPVPTASLLVHYMHQVGFYGRGMAGIEPLSPMMLRAWQDGTATELGPIDFQDMLDASRVYVGAFRDYDGKPVPAPWEPDMTPEQEAEALERQRAAMDRAMGVG